MFDPNVEWAWILDPSTNWDKLSTRELLSDLGRLKIEIRRMVYDDEPADLSDHVVKLKEVLATREHVPNKEEGRAARQLKQGRPSKKVLSYGR